MGGGGGIATVEAEAEGLVEAAAEAAAEAVREVETEAALPVCAEMAEASLGWLRVRLRLRYAQRWRRRAWDG